MKRLPRVLSAIVLLAPVLVLGKTSQRFDARLAPDKQIIHVLNRLTFGARPDDVAEVRRVGVERWIALQLNPDRIPENPVLEARLEPLESLNLLTWQINEKYAPPQPMRVQRVQPTSVLTAPQMATLRNGTNEERRELIMSLPAEVRNAVLPTLSPPMTEGLQEEVAKARQAQEQALQAERRRLMPPLNELLSPDQVRQLRAGTDQEKLAIINSLEPEKRQQVLRSLAQQPQLLQGLPKLRREATALTQPQQLVNAELIENKLYRAIYSNHQLEEVLVDFWLNHFNVYNGKAQGRILLTSYERDAIRPYVFGRFKDMLLATARHPAMLMYLDNVNSQAPRDDGPTFAPNQQLPRRPGLNENYGRELMELHTLGVDGGYTQEDVVAVARAFTGWTVVEPNRRAEFTFNVNMHDRKEKKVLEQVLPPDRGEQDGLDVIDILVHHPSTAKFISRKLAQRFVADDPPKSLVDRMAATFTKTDGDLRAVLQTMFSSTEFSSEAAFQSKLKSPLEIVVSSVRALNAEAVDTVGLAQRIAEMGQPLYGKVEPTGYPNTGESWASTAGILARINFATDLTAGRIPGVKADMSRFNFKPPAVVATELLGGTPFPGMVESIEKGIQGKEVSPSMLATVVLSSPEFQRR